MPAFPDLSLEHRLLSLHDAACVVGMDEVGRGALAGPVTVGAVAVGPHTGQPPAGLQDSKLLTAQRRQAMFDKIDSWALGWAVGHASPQEIDCYGIVGGLRLAGYRALDTLASSCGPLEQIILDGSHDWLTPQGETPGNYFGQYVSPLCVTMRVKADMSCASVAAASVMAKVLRDALMDKLSQEHPQYQWSRNKGYATVAHRRAIVDMGPSDVHRLSWKLC